MPRVLLPTKRGNVTLWRQWWEVREFRTRMGCHVTIMVIVQRV